MPSIWSDTVSGSGTEVFGDIQVTDMIIDVVTLGTLARRLELNDPDHILRFGWVSFGRIEDEFTEPRHYWRAPIWIDFEHMFWTPVPQYQAGAADLTIWAHEIRWSLSPGGSIFIDVRGF